MSCTEPMYCEQCQRPLQQRDPRSVWRCFSCFPVLVYEGTNAEYLLVGSARPCVECRTLTHRLELDFEAHLCCTGCYKEMERNYFEALLRVDLGEDLDQGEDDAWS